MAQSKSVDNRRLTARANFIVLSSTHNWVDDLQLTTNELLKLCQTITDPQGVGSPKVPVIGHRQTSQSNQQPWDTDPGQNLITSASSWNLNGQSRPNCTLSIISLQELRCCGLSHSYNTFFKNRQPQDTLGHNQDFFFNGDQTAQTTVNIHPFCSLHYYVVLMFTM